MTEEVKKLDPNWQKRLEKVGKNTFQRQEMLRLGFCWSWASISSAR